MPTTPAEVTVLMQDVKNFLERAVPGLGPLASDGAALLARVRSMLDGPPLEVEPGVLRGDSILANRIGPGDQVEIAVGAERRAHGWWFVLELQSHGWYRCEAIDGKTIRRWQRSDVVGWRPREDD